MVEGQKSSKNDKINQIFANRQQWAGQTANPVGVWGHEEVGTNHIIAVLGELRHYPLTDPQE